MSAVSLDEAVALVMASAPEPKQETVLLAEAHGRVLATDLEASADQPSHDVSAMDGYAARGADTAGASETHPMRLRLVGDSAAGSPFGGSIGEFEVVSISTGASLPEGADSIALLEQTVVSEGETVEPGVYLLRPSSPKHVRRKGEMFRQRGTYLFTGDTLNAFEVGIAAALGFASVPVRARPRVAVVTTGSELLPPGAPFEAHTVFDSNGPLVAALVHRFGGDPVVVPRVSDTNMELAGTLSSVPDVDLVVTTGGVSVGRHDEVRKLLGQMGSLAFDRVRVRPGGPTLFGAWHGRKVLSLPGNPVAAALLGTILIGAWFHQALGKRGQPPFARRHRAVALTPVRAVEDKSCLWLASTGVDASGRLTVSVLESQSSARIATLRSADALAVMPPGASVDAGVVVDILPLSGGRAVAGGAETQGEWTIRSGPA